MHDWFLRAKAVYNYSNLVCKDRVFRTCACPASCDNPAVFVSPGCQAIRATDGIIQMDEKDEGTKRMKRTRHGR